jgi:Zn-dependent protease
MRLGRFAGIEARAHWSLLFIAFLVAQLLAVGILPAAAPGLPAAAYWLAGAASAVVFLASVLAHELAHAAIARRHDIPVERVTLWLLGGATELGHEAKTPRAEAAIAASGPITSLVLGGVFAGLAALASGAGLLTATLAWLAGVNLLLGVFNLLPAAPLDGGRLLRAALWRRYGDWTRATYASARAGSVLGALLIAWGLLQVFGGQLFGLWLALIGWFVLTAAAAERTVAAGKRLTGRTVRDLMTTPPAVAPSWWSVANFLAQADSTLVRSAVVPLVDFDGSPRSLLTMRDLQRVAPDDRDTTRLRDAARSRVPVLVLDPDTPASDVVLPLRARGGVAVVVEDARVVGTLSSVDITAAMMLAGLTDRGLTDRGLTDRGLTDRAEGPHPAGPSSTGVTEPAAGAGLTSNH